MKSLLFTFMTLFATFLFGCQNSSQSLSTNSEAQSDSVAVAQDSLDIYLKQLDSISSKGTMVHYDIYKIGKLKGIFFEVHKVKFDETVLCYINLRKDCGNEYYYKWENAFIFQPELSSFYEAITSLKSELNRMVDHEEKYVYKLKDDVALGMSAEPSKKWSIKLSIDISVPNSSVNLSEQELDQFLELMKQCDNKLTEIK